MTDQEKTSYTVSITGEAWIETPLEDEFENSVELIITSDVKPSRNQAAAILKALYPNRKIDGVTVSLI